MPPAWQWLRSHLWNPMPTDDKKQALINLITSLTTHFPGASIGRSGGARPLPEPGQGDIDLFVYCERIPTARTRMAASRNVAVDVETNKLKHPRWGTGDLMWLGGVETWVMYMNRKAAHNEVTRILSGAEPNREDNYFYPTGRLAMLNDMQILADPGGFIAGLQRMVRNPPESLFERLWQHHTTALLDVEDLTRAAARGDVLFFHFALDLAIDHFLQAIFALNHAYFPSRKRSIPALDGFKRKPHDCSERLLVVLSYSVTATDLPEAMRRFEHLTSELLSLHPGTDYPS